MCHDSTSDIARSDQSNFDEIDRQANVQRGFGKRLICLLEYRIVRLMYVTQNIIRTSLLKSHHSSTLYVCTAISRIHLVQVEK